MAMHVGRLEFQQNSLQEGDHARPSDGENAHPFSEAEQALQTYFDRLGRVYKVGQPDFERVLNEREEIIRLIEVEGDQAQEPRQLIQIVDVVILSEVVLHLLDERGVPVPEAEVFQELYIIEKELVFVHHFEALLQVVLQEEAQLIALVGLILEQALLM